MRETCPKSALLPVVYGEHFPPLFLFHSPPASLDSYSPHVNLSWFPSRFAHWLKPHPRSWNIHSLLGLSLCSSEKFLWQLLRERMKVREWDPGGEEPLFRDHRVSQATRAPRSFWVTEVASVLELRRLPETLAHPRGTKVSLLSRWFCSQNIVCCITHRQVSSF